MPPLDIDNISKFQRIANASAQFGGAERPKLDLSRYQAQAALEANEIFGDRGFVGRTEVTGFTVGTDNKLAIADAASATRAAKDLLANISEYKQDPEAAQSAPAATNAKVQPTARSK